MGSAKAEPICRLPIYFFFPPKMPACGNLVLEPVAFTESARRQKAGSGHKTADRLS